MIILSRIAAGPTLRMLQALQTEARTLERRRHQRVPVVLLGRFMREDRSEYPCQSKDCSPGGFAVLAPVPVTVGERVVIYFEHLGRVEGRIVRTFEHGFAVALTATRRKQDKLATQLTWLANRHILGLPEGRRHERITPRVSGAIVHLPDGSQVGVRVIDISLSGAALSCPVQPPLGSPVTVGRTAAKVVRHFDGGFAAEFLRILPQHDFGEDYVL